MAAPTPKAPKPGADWIPTADGQGWLPGNMAGSDAAWKEPAAAPPPPGTPAAPPLPTPTQGAAAHTPLSGPMMAAPPPPIPPPAAAPEKVAAPVLGPMVDTGGVATHDPAQAIPPPGAAPAPAAPAAAPEPAAPDPLNTAMRDALLKMLDAKDPSMSDPALAAQSGAFGVQQQRAKERARAAMAERAAAQGGVGVDSGAFEGGIRGLEEAQGEAQGAFDAGLLQKELEARRSQLMQAAALAGNQLSAEDQLAFQREFAQIDAELKKAQLAQQGSQFDRSFTQRADEFGKQFGIEGQRLAESIRQFDVNTETGRMQIKQQLDMFKDSQAQQGKQFDVDAALRKMGIDSQTALGGRDLDLRDKLGSGSLMMQYLQALIGNSNFKDNLGANIGMFNQKSILDLLFGGR